MLNKLLRLILVLVIILPQNLFATEQMILNGSNGGTLVSATRYFPGWGAATGASAEANRKSSVSTTTTLRNMRISLSLAPGAGASFIFSSRKNAGAGAQSCTISGDTNKTCSDDSNTDSLVLGDFFDLQVSSSGTISAPVLAYSFTMDSSTDGESNLSGGLGGTALSTTLTEYIPLSGNVDTPNTIEARTHTLIPGTFTVKNFSVTLDTAPGVGSARVLTVRKNDATSSLTCTVSGAATTCSDVSNTISAIAGDVIDVEDVPDAGTPPAAS